MRKPIIIGIGEVLWDLLPEGKQLGGAPANFAYQCAKLGAEAYVVSAIGNDVLGDEILELFREKQLSTEYISIDRELPTGTVDVFLNQAGGAQYKIRENVAWDRIPFYSRQEGLAKKADAICFGSLAQRSAESRKTILRVLSQMPKDSLRVFDCNFRTPFYTPDIILQSLHASNILKLNEEEIIALARILGTLEDHQQMAALLLERFNLDLIALTLGAAGSSLFTKNTQSFLPAPTIEIADTIGAGDAFTAAIVMGLLENLPLNQVHEKAVTLSSYVCTRSGAMV